jgi:hypothetical protein
MRNFVTPIQKPLVSEKALKIGKKTIIVASIVAIGLLCGG